MKSKKIIFVANWKSELSITQTVQYCEEHSKELNSLALHTGNMIILCPTIPTIALVHQYFKNSSVYLGSQNCSPFPKGPYTGEIDAQTIKEAGCSYCIIGHSERRLLFQESNTIIAHKILQTLDAHLIPIICIGQRDINSPIDITMRTLQQQLRPVKKLLENRSKLNYTLLIAYEPVGAIGTGKTPDPIYLRELFTRLHKYVTQWNLKNVSFNFLYGGSVNETTIIPMVHIDQLNGFLIARASLDFQKFKNMISLST